MRQSILAALLVSIMAMPAGIAAANTLVVLDVAGDSDLRRGDVLEAEAGLFLGAETRVTLVNEAGEKIEVVGPFQGIVESPTDEGEAALVQKMAALFKSNRVGTAIRTYRTFGTATPAPWDYVPAEGGNYCFDDPDNLSLWRDSTDRDDRVLFTSPEGEAAVKWNRGDTVLNWPVDLPRRNGQSYNLAISSGPAVDLTLLRVPATLPTRMHTAAWMSENGCPNQAMLLALTADVDRLLEGLGKAGKF
ncbi:hypothetical protein EOI86_02330 [Hwanghaeella grinnelliae]|uniref:DUF2330 domain-containing protein n=1 Tax=Hwanghaeella grinnelliae TaxID=2500179 RepID=A0A3S3UQG4_9PROT|nr:hypothetical protein [Hwanghaeella grinnelliae]RVU38160.1 hypothetical protein EOI86_02330 [Hwanghaeella grinnelliae]